MGKWRWSIWLNSEGFGSLHADLAASLTDTDTAFFSYTTSIFFNFGKNHFIPVQLRIVFFSMFFFENCILKICFQIFELQKNNTLSLQGGGGPDYTGQTRWNQRFFASWNTVIKKMFFFLSIGSSKICNSQYFRSWIKFSWFYQYLDFWVFSKKNMFFENPS